MTVRPKVWIDRSTRRWHVTAPGRRVPPGGYRSHFAALLKAQHIATVDPERLTHYSGEGESH